MRTDGATYPRREMARITLTAAALALGAAAVSADLSIALLIGLGADALSALPLHERANVDGAAHAGGGDQ